MSDKEIADRLVELGIGCRSDVGRYDVTDWRKGEASQGDALSEELIARMCPLFDKQFVRDWRVAGACLERMEPVQISLAVLNYGGSEIMQKPRAICAAYVEAQE
jgi:hypothetical protein